MDKVVISSEKNFEKLKDSFIDSNKFHVIADFDRTLTFGALDGKRNPSLIALIRDGGHLTKDYPKKSQALYDKFRPIEIDPNLSIEEKSKKMDEWWRAHFDLLAKCGMNKGVIDDIVRRNEAKFREGSLEFLDLLHKENIPLIIMSAGPGQLIEEFLRKKDRFYDNIQVIANHFIFNEEGVAIGRRDPQIHTFNKKEFVVKDLPVYQDLLKRKNVLLLGDSIGDIDMVDGFPYDNLIKIGFLNENIEDNIEDYQKSYDVIIKEDGDFSFVNELLKEIIN
jgi:5'-nucleotidase